MSIYVFLFTSQKHNIFDLSSEGADRVYNC